MPEIALFIIGGFILYLIIANAVKMAVKEALHEFKEEIVAEFGIKKVSDNDKETESE